MTVSTTNRGTAVPGTTREIRIFVSSTFRDMQRERELLVKQVFPELRRICAQRFVTITEVDFRWGITQEQAAEGKVLPICLEEIDLARPYFIGLLGERYGWIPNSVPPSVIAKEPWLREPVGNRTSVTELEILHGALNNPEIADHAYFYFRDAKYIETLPEPERREMIERDIPEEVCAFGKDEAAHRTEERKAKLAALKQRIRQSGLTLIENYQTPESFAVAVREHLLNLIDRLYPEIAMPDLLEQETRDQDSYAARKLIAFVPRSLYANAFDTFVASSNGPGLVLTGDSGCGKSVLLMDWVGQWRASHRNDFVFAHYFGSTPDSASVLGFLRRLLGELKRRFDLQDEVPSKPEELHEALPLWLTQTVGKGRIILVLDALNQIQGEESDRRLVWLPRHMPPHVRIIASALEGPVLAALRKRSWPEHVLPPLEETERGKIIDKFFQHYRKTPTREMRDQLSAAPGSANPLFLRTVMEELRQFGNFEQLPFKASEYLTASTPEDLLRLVLHRWQQDFDGERAFVRRALCQLWAARRGLSEIEWLELLGAPDEPLPRQIWSPLFLAMEPHLALRGGLYAFGHEFLRSAVGAEFLTGESERCASHLELAGYFEAQMEMSDRKVAEWPWQLRAAESWSRLETALTDLDLFVALYKETSKWELTAYWMPLRQRGRDMEACYEAAYQRSASHDSHLAYSLGAFLINNGCFRVGKILTEKAALSSTASSLGEFDANYATTQNNLAHVLEEQGEFARAASILEKVLSVYELSFGAQDRFTATACINLAGSYLHMGRWGEAEPLIRRALAIDELIYGIEHPEVATDLTVLAECLRASGKLSEAEAVLERALSICRGYLPPKHPLLATVLSNLASILVQTERPQKAEPLAQEAVEIDRECLGNEHPKLAIRLNNLAAVMKANGHIRDATASAREALEILVEVSVRAGVPHRDLEAASLTFASLVAEAGLPPQLVIPYVNNILRPMQELTHSAQIQQLQAPMEKRKQTSIKRRAISLFQSIIRSSIMRGPKSFPISPDPDIEREEQHPTLTSGPACDALITNDQRRPSTGEALNSCQVGDRDPSQRVQDPKSISQIREAEVSALSQILAQLDPGNLQYRAERGDPQAQCNIAVMLESEGDVEQAATWYRRAAENGVAHAQFNLAVLLQNGTGVEQNEVESVKWYAEAARQGHLNAIYKLAFMRENGYGCVRDLKTAFHLYETAANQKEPDSECKLALLLLEEDMQTRAGFPYRREGWGFVPKDHKRAEHLLREAAGNRHTLSIELLGKLGWS